ncbi:MAG TPA: threonine synthase, partial [Thermomicrobiales bacterium]|nr:threonine synthase [Thermomicrobiales bacterium]
ALRALWSQGLYVEPTAALGAAAFIRFALDNRLQDDGAHVVLITGSGLKATEAIGELLAG